MRNKQNRHSIVQIGEIKMLKFGANNFVSLRTGQHCVVGALARACGYTEDYLRRNPFSGVDSCPNMLSRLSKQFNIPEDELGRLQDANDRYDWERVNKMLRKYGLIKTVRLYAKKSV